MSQLIPLFPLELVLLPGAPLPLHIFEPRYKEMIAEVMSQNDQFGLVRLLNNNSIAEVGCTAEVLEVTKKYDDGRMDIVTQGQKRFEIARLDQERTFLRAEVTFFEDDPGAAAKAELDKLVDLHKELVGVSGGESPEVELDDPQLSFQLAGSLPLDLDFKQTLLGMRSEEQRVTAMIEYYNALIPQLKRTIKVREKAKGNGHAM